MSELKLCAHVKHDGTLCQAIPIHDSPYCYFHRSYYKAPALPGEPKYQAPLLESHHSIQLAVTDLYQSFVTGKISLKEATLALRLLRLASKTITEIERNAKASTATATSSPTPVASAAKGTPVAPDRPTMTLTPTADKPSAQPNPFVNPKSPQSTPKADRYVDPYGCLAPMVEKEKQKNAFK